MLVVN